MLQQNILLHSSMINILVETCFFCCPKTKSVLNILGYILKQFQRFFEKYAKLSSNKPQNVLNWFHLQTTRQSCWQLEKSYKKLYYLFLLLSFRCITTVTLMGDKTVSFVPVEQCSIKKCLFATGGTTQIVRPQNLITGSMTTYIR